MKRAAFISSLSTCILLPIAASAQVQTANAGRINEIKSVASDESDSIKPGFPTNPLVDSSRYTGNTLVGHVNILKLDGKPRKDRSNIVVFLDHVEGHFVRPAVEERPVLSQKNRNFEPKVLPIMKGTTVDFPNEDTIFHNVFSLSKAKPMDLDVYPPGKSKSVTFKNAGWVKVYCNIHPKMIAHILVLNNPFFSLTDEKGEFRITVVPDGNYLLRTWHEFGEEVRNTVILGGETTKSLSIEIQENKRFVQHKNKFGTTYSSKY